MPANGASECRITSSDQAGPAGEQVEWPRSQEHMWVFKAHLSETEYSSNWTGVVALEDHT